MTYSIIYLVVVPGTVAEASSGLPKLKCTIHLVILLVFRTTRKLLYLVLLIVLYGSSGMVLVP